MNQLIFGSYVWKFIPNFRPAHVFFLQKENWLQSKGISYRLTFTLVIYGQWIYKYIAETYWYISGWWIGTYNDHIYDFISVIQAILSNVRTDFQLDLILILVNLSCKLGQIMTRYDFQEAWRVILRKIRTDSNLISILVNLLDEFGANNGNVQTDSNFT